MIENHPVNMGFREKSMLLIELAGTDAITYSDWNWIGDARGLRNDIYSFKIGRSWIQVGGLIHGIRN
ncbi:hypothetical protein QE152_g445 [Popillia japonica]|uniref:Uncharacterized protein n=1 Tax=Popillia japonica TaxID=7064 RepID=A0AAW1NK10_POPJA